MRTRKIVALVIAIYNLIGLIVILGLAPSDPFYRDGNECATSWKDSLKSSP